ncbi:hypothetical protein F01_530197 [Burkholderia cenocepacia]|nr:hypothetical protein F01_530197 [Burkholderia cenocepacia]
MTLRRPCRNDESAPSPARGARVSRLSSGPPGRMACIPLNPNPRAAPCRARHHQGENR